MKIFVLLLVATLLPAAGWESVRRLSPDQKVEILTHEGTRTRAAWVSATEDSVAVRDSKGERSINRSEIRRLRVHDTGRRVRQGLIWTAAGGAAGSLAGSVACLTCPNEGAGFRHIARGFLGGAVIGALGFLSSPYRTVYEAKRP